MDLRLLEYFLAVAEEENVTRASENLHISQPSLSRQIAQLEVELGVQLFERTNKSVKLTPEGRILKGRATEILALTEKTRLELQNESKLLAGDIYLGAVEIDSFQILARTMNKFNLAHPKVHFQVYSDNSKGIQDGIDRGLLDFGFLLGPVNFEKYNFYKLPVHEQWGVILPMQHLLANKTVLKEKDLSTQRLICPYRLLNDKTLLSWFPKLGEYNVTASYNLIGSAVNMVKQGLGIAICMKKERYNRDGLLFIPLQPAHLEKEAYLIWKKNHVIAKTTEYFLAEFCNQKDTE